MGQIHAAREPMRLAAVLGSCVGVAIIHKRLKIGALGHVVLPNSAGRTSAPGKFADSAIPAMLQTLAQMGAPSTGLVAKIAGGANMFATRGPLQIGDANIEAVTNALAAAGITLVAKSVGGTQGRRVTLDCATGDYAVEIVGQPLLVL